MRARDALYDELCRMLTDYEGNGSGGYEDRPTAEDLYGMLVKVQNAWETLVAMADD